MTMRLLAVRLGFFLSLTCAGCGGGGGGNVKGTLSKGGTPLTDAKIVFHSDKGQYAATAGAGGKFELPSTPPVLPGTYKVTVMKYEALPGAPQGMDIDQLVLMGRAKLLVPVEYTKPDRTPLSVTVKEGSNDVPLEVK